MKIKIKSNAKINIGLDVVKKREDGYHELDMIMVPIDLYDFIDVEIFDEKGELTITTNKLEIPVDNSNIMAKVYNCFYEKSGIEKRKMTVYLEKNIPFSAGLGGGSGNGAEIIKFLNSYHGNIFTEKELIEMTMNIGADIPFFIVNKSARVRGIGEKIEIIENNSDFGIILVKPDFGINTKYAYGLIQNIQNKKCVNIEEIVNGLKNGEIPKIEKNIENSIWQAVRENDINVIEFEKKLKKDSNNFYMSGSGSCYFTMVKRENSEKTYKEMVEKFKECFVSLHLFLK